MPVARDMADARSSRTPGSGRRTCCVPLTLSRRTRAAASPEIRYDDNRCLVALPWRPAGGGGRWSAPPLSGRPTVRAAPERLEGRAGTSSTCAERVRRATRAGRRYRLHVRSAGLPRRTDRWRRRRRSVSPRRRSQTGQPSTYRTGAHPREVESLLAGRDHRPSERGRRPLVALAVPCRVSPRGRLPSSDDRPARSPRCLALGLHLTPAPVLLGA